MTNNQLTTITPFQAAKIEALMNEHFSSWGIQHESVRLLIREILEVEFPGLGEELLTDWLITLNPLSSLEWFIAAKKRHLAGDRPFHCSFHAAFRPFWEKIKHDFPDYPSITAATELAWGETNDKLEVLLLKSTLEDFKRYLLVWQWCLDNGVNHHRWFTYWRENDVPFAQREIYPGCKIL